MFWHLLSLFAAATPTCATPRQSLKRCLKAICIFESRRRRWFFNQSTRVSCLAVVNVFPACSSPFAPGVPGELFYCRRSFGLMRRRRAEHESRLIYLNVFECEATSLFLSLSPRVVFAVSAHFAAEQGETTLALLTWIYGISLAELKPLLASQDVNNFPVTPLHINQILLPEMRNCCSILHFAIKFRFSVATATQQSGKTQI